MSSSATPDGAVSSQTQARLKGKSVLLTGATGGLGSELARQILQHCQVKTLILSGRNPEALQKMANELQQEETGGGHSSESTSTEIVCIPCDLSDRNSVQQLGIQALQKQEKIDCLILCGGVSSRSNFVNTKLEIDERIMQINFLSGVALCKLLVPAMMENTDTASPTDAGIILWISSVQGLVGIPSRTSYAASKFAVQGYCEALRAELTPSHIQVSCVSPGYIRTNLSNNALQGDGSSYGKLDDTTANGADPRDVAVEVLDKAVGDHRTDFVVAATASAKAAIWMRLLCPGILQSLLVKRFQKQQQKQQDGKQKNE